MKYSTAPGGCPQDIELMGDAYNCLMGIESQYSTADLKNLSLRFSEFKILDLNLLIFFIEDN